MKDIFTDYKLVMFKLIKVKMKILIHCNEDARRKFDEYSVKLFSVNLHELRYVKTSLFRYCMLRSRLG